MFLFSHPTRTWTLTPTLGLRHELSANSSWLAKKGLIPDLQENGRDINDICGTFLLSQLYFLFLPTRPLSLLWPYTSPSNNTHSCSPCFATCSSNLLSLSIRQDANLSLVRIESSKSHGTSVNGSSVNCPFETSSHWWISWQPVPVGS